MTPSRRIAARPDDAPPFIIPPTQAAWTRMRRTVRVTLWRLLGDLPPRPQRPRARAVRIAARDGYVVEHVEIESGDGPAIPGYVLIPDAVRRGGRAPAVLYHHWHGGEYEVGKAELFQRRHTPEEPGPALARRGYVVLAIDARGFGERAGQGPGRRGERGAAEELSASKRDLWLGRTRWGSIVRDDLVALDYLLTRREVDPARVGATGISMGATRTWWAMALDERIRAGVAVGCLTRYANLLRSRRLDAHGVYYYVPGILQHFDTEAVVSLIAPRPVLFLTGGRDPGSPAGGIRRIAATVRQAYALYDRPAHFESRIYPGVGHRYTSDMWSRTLRWLDSSLRD